MEQISFIGVNDKKDLLLNVAKTITKLNKRVLIVDATLMQRLRYIVPKISSVPTYVSEYDGVDVAVGFMDLRSIANYLGKSQLDYDYIFIDTDNPRTLQSFMAMNSKINFLATSYDEFEVQKILEILSTFRGQVQLTKLIISADINNKHEEYLNHILENFQINWSDYKVQFSDTESDRKATLVNQLTKQITFKNYTSTYKDSLEYLTSLILEGVVEQSLIRKVIRKK